MPTIAKNKIIWDAEDWMYGLTSQHYFYSNTASNYRGSCFETAIDPFIAAGYLSCGRGSGAITNFVSGTSPRFVSFTNSVNKKTYLVGSTEMEELDAGAATPVLTDSAVFPHTIASATFSDCIEYYIGATSYIFGTYNNATVGNIVRYDKASTFVDTYLTTTLAATGMVKTYGHPMIIGDDDILYVGDGPNLHALDGQLGANGTWFTDVLKFPKGFEIKGFAKIEPRSLVVFAEKNSGSSDYPGEVMVQFWDYLEEDAYKVARIENAYEVGGMFSTRGTVGCFTRGMSVDENTGYIMKNLFLMVYNTGTGKFERKESVSAGDVGVNAFKVPLYRGTEIREGQILANFNGYVFSFGSPHDGISAGMHQPYNIYTDTGDPGIITKAYVDRTFVSGSESVGGDSLFSYMNTGSFSFDGYYKSGYAEPIFDTNKRGIIKKVRIEFRDEQTTAGQGVSVFFLDRDANEVLRAMNEVVTISDRVVEFEYNSSDNNNSKNFDALQLVVDWNGGTGSTISPQIRRVIVDYDTINIK